MSSQLQDNILMIKNKLDIAGNYIDLISTHNPLYTELEYIESTGTQWIDTGIVPNSLIKIIQDASYNNTNGNQRAGWGSSANAEAFYWGMLLSEENFISSVSDNWGRQNTLVAKDVKRHIWKLESGNQTFDNIPYGNSTIKNTATSGQTLYIFAFHTEYSGSQDYNYLKLYNFKIYDNDTLVRNYIPSRRNSDNEIGLYDIVNNTFYMNQGTGKFIAGPVVSLPYGYTKLEYIGSTGTQWIDTGVIPNKDLTIEAKLNPQEASGGIYIGVRGDSDSTDYRFFYTNNIFYFDNGSGRLQLHQGNIPVLNNDLIIKLGNYYILRNSTQIVTGATRTANPAQNYSIGIFGGVLDGQVNYAKFKLYYCKIWDENNNLIRNYIPARRDIDNELGLYNTIDNIFYTNAGTGSFVAGPEVV